jgi:FkbM family methyltransferase
MVTMHDEAAAQLYNHTHQLLTSHEKLLEDAGRNRPFFRALKQAVRAGSSVLDIGAGTGIWAIVAARLGAQRVVAIEQDPLLSGLIKTLARENGVADRVEVVVGESTTVEVAGQFDIVISETIGHLVFDEQVVPIMIDARTRFLKPGGVLIPQTVALVAAPAHLRNFPQRLPAGIPVDFDGFESLVLHAPAGSKDRAQLTSIGEPRDLIRIDLTSVDALPELHELTARWTLPATKKPDPKPINCFAVWSAATLTKGTRGIQVATPRTTSWLPEIYRINPFQADRGELEFKLTLTSETNYWTATLSHDQGQETQSYSPAFAATTLMAQMCLDGAALGHLQGLGALPSGRHPQS